MVTRAVSRAADSGSRPILQEDLKSAANAALSEASRPPSHAMHIGFVSVTELATHFRFFMGNVDEISGGENRHRRSQHWPSPDPECDPKCCNHESEIHGVSRQSVRTPGNQLAVCR